ncbi:MAG: LytTR family DNA-binding domain-containing protein [Bacteroidota bacterium]
MAGKRIYLTFRTLSSFASQLPEEAFFKTHKSFILHKKYIAYVEGNSVWMKNQKRIPLGKNNRQEFLRFLGGPTP